MQAGEVAGGHREGEAGSYAVDAAVDGLRHASHGLGPAEGLLDLLAVLLGQGVAGVAGGAAVDGGVPSLLRDMRGWRASGNDPGDRFSPERGLSEIGDEAGAVEALVGAQREAAGRARGMAVDHVECRAAFGVAVGPGQLGLDDEAVAVLHQRMPHVAQHRTGALRLAEQPGIGVGDRGMGGVGALLAAEIDFGVAVAAAGAGRRGGLGFGLGRGKVGGGLLTGVLGSVRRRAGFRARCDCPAGPEPGASLGASPGPSVPGGLPSVFGWKLFMEAQALISVPSTEKCSSDKSGATSRCARIAAITLRAMSVVSSRSRFLVNTVGTQT